jgi:hypothetical protein
VEKEIVQFNFIAAMSQLSMLATVASETLQNLQSMRAVA